MGGRPLRTRADFLSASGVLLVLRDPVPAVPPVRGQPTAVASNPSEGPEILLSVWDDGRIVALHGHVDLGTGVRTAFAQIVAEELGVDVDQVDMILGDTGTAPNQGPTIASASLQIHAQPLRIAAAQARRHLLARAAGVLGAAADLLQVSRGVVSARPSDGAEAPTVTYAQLVSGQNERLTLDLENIEMNPTTPPAGGSFRGLPLPTGTASTRTNLSPPRAVHVTNTVNQARGMLGIGQPNVVRGTSKAGMTS